MLNHTEYGVYQEQILVLSRIIFYLLQYGYTHIAQAHASNHWQAPPAPKQLAIMQQCLAVPRPHGRYTCDNTKLAKAMRSMERA